MNLKIKTGTVGYNNNILISNEKFMSQSIPTGYIPPGNPRENFFERANPGHPGKIFCLIPCPGTKNDSRIPGVGQNFPKLEETAP